MPVAETTFGVVYDGPALASGRMPVRDLAPALLALGDLFAEAAEVIYPEGGPVGLSIEATDRGSFDVHLVLVARDLWDQVVDIFGSEGATALANLEAVVLGTYGLFALLRRIGSRRIEKNEQLEAGYVRITLDDGTTIEAYTDVGRLLDRYSIRRKARDVVAPLERDGVDELRLSQHIDSEPSVVIGSDDLAAYEAAATEEGDVLLDEERDQLFTIASVSFEGKKWRLSDGNLTFWASVDDTEFLDSVERRESFAKGDLLVCRIRIIQSQRPTGGLKTEYHVVRVLRHIRGDQQTSFEDVAGSRA